MAERRGGQIIIGMQESGELLAPGQTKRKVPSSSTLEEHEIDVHESHRWQVIASVDEATQLRAERKMGGILAGMKERGERKRSGKESQGATRSDLGVEKNESSRWQKMASLDEQARAVADFIGPFAFHLPGGREDRGSGVHWLITNRFWSAGAPLRTFRLLLQGQGPNNREPLPLSVISQWR